MANEDQENLGLVLPQATRRGKSLGLKAAAGVGRAEDANNYTCSILLLGLNSSQESNPLWRKETQESRSLLNPGNLTIKRQQKTNHFFLPVTETRRVQLMENPGP